MSGLTQQHWWQLKQEFLIESFKEETLHIKIPSRNYHMLQILLELPNTTSHGKTLQSTNKFVHTRNPTHETLFEVPTSTLQSTTSECSSKQGAARNIPVLSSNRARPTKPSVFRVLQRRFLPVSNATQSVRRLLQLNSIDNAIWQESAHTDGELTQCSEQPTRV